MLGHVWIYVRPIEFNKETVRVLKVRWLSTMLIFGSVGEAVSSPTYEKNIQGPVLSCCRVS